MSDRTLHMGVGQRRLRFAARTLCFAFSCWLCCVAGTGVLSAQASPTTDSLPSPLTLDRVQRYAREHRSEIVAASARARAAAERPAMVSGLEDPMITPSLDHVPFMLHGADFSLSIEQRFPLSRVLGNRARAAAADARRLRADVERVRLDVELDSVSAFLMLYERQQMAQIFDAQLGVARQFVDAASARYASGTGAQSELLRAELEVARIESAVRTNRAQTHAAEAMLNAALGRAPDAGLPPLETEARMALPPQWSSLRQAALGGRPELMVGRAEISRAEAEVSVMDSMDAPMAMVRTGPAYTMNDGFGFMLMVGVSIPLWRERVDAGVHEAQAMAQMARADLDAMTRMVEGEAASSRELVVAARERVLALRDDVLPRAQRALEPALSGYASGTLPLVSVLEAGQVLWSTQAELVAAEIELDFAWARLERATGVTEGTRP